MENTNNQIGAKAEEKAVCSNCNKEVLVGQTSLYKGKRGEAVYICNDCTGKMNEEFEKETKNINFPMAFLFGLAGAALSGLMWFLVATITNLAIGYVALAVGYLIGFAVYFGAGKKRGIQLQVMSLLLTAVTLFVAEYSITVYVLNEFASEASVNGMILVSPFDWTLWKEIATPVLLLIWGIALYIAFRVPQARKL
ncbi:MAG: hypothetical protein HYV77_00855 [Candidatus Wildermuthbacteria bacterium]|nr:hypothetical protein [Candidatus Wildermuthbacteria bacterium]